MQVKDLMSKDLFVLYADDNILLAEEMMQWKRIRHIPVVDRHYNLKGLVTHRDMLRASISTRRSLASTNSSTACRAKTRPCPTIAGRCARRSRRWRG